MPTTIGPSKGFSNGTTAGRLVPINAIEEEWGLAAVVVFSILMVLFIIVGALGNLLVMVSVAVTKEMRNRSFMFIFNLSVTDLLTSIIGMPIALATLQRGTWPFSQAVCQFNGFTTEFCFVATIHTLMYISVYRYISISNPLNKRRMGKVKVILLICAPWVYAAILCGATFELGSYTYLIHTTQCDPVYTKDSRGWADLSITIITGFGIPLIVMVVMYLLIFIKARQHFQRLKTCSNAEDKAYLQQQRLSMTFFMILLAFIVCWLPLMIYSIYSALVDDKKTLPLLANPIVYWLSYMNSAINPVLYSIRTPLLKSLFRRMCGKKAFTETYVGSDVGDIKHSVISRHGNSISDAETPFL